jgi:ATP-dependent Clp protease protease subunit
MKKLLNEIMARNTGQTVKKIETDMERDFWMSAEEAKKYGLVDKVIQHR